MAGEPLPCEPRYGKRLLPDIIDELAKTDPQRAFVKIPSGTDEGSKHGYRTVNYVQLATAINRAAWWLREQLGKIDGFPTVAYVGQQDLRYFLLCIGGSKAGWKIFFPSPRNDLKANISLLQAYKCEKLLLPAGPIFRGLFSPTIQASGIQCLDVPEIDFFLDASAVKPFTWRKSFEDGRLEPLLTIQTSGSTGSPKPVIMPHGSVSSIDAYHVLPSLGSAPICFAEFTGRNVACAFPFFHAAGIAMLFMAVVFEYTLILPPPGPLHAQMVADLVKEHEITAAILPPSVIVDLAADDQLVHTFKQLEYVVYGGGPLPTDVGNKVNRLTQVITGYGGTEFAYQPMPLNDREDWIYLAFPKQAGAQFRPYTDGLYELVFVRDPALRDFQCVFMTFPELHEYATKDLFAPHPTKPDLWRFCGRSDDILVYSTGNKFNPSKMEDTLNGHPAVKSALMCGTARFQSAILIEPVQYPTDRQSAEALIDSLWPMIEVENKDSPGYARVTRNMILIGSADKPFPRASKGTVQRQLAFNLYKGELDRLYSLQDDGDQLHHPIMNGNTVPKDLIASILDAVHHMAGLEHITVTDRLFDSGMDSLGAVTLGRNLRKLALKHGLKRNVTPIDVYRCGTVEALAAYLTDASERPISMPEQMQALYERYTKDLPITARPVSKKPTDARCVVLTGSTGSLGTSLLDALLRDEKVAHIVCLNRTADAEERQKASMQDKGLCTNFDSKNVDFIQADFSMSYLGIGARSYRQLLDQVTHIIHNAWSVNFNTSLEDFATTHINGVRQLVDFSARSRYGSSIIFTSSIGAVQRWTGKGAVPEAIVDDWTTAGDVGYSAAKLVSERILAEAATIAGVPSAICRLGQIAGPISSKGIWPKQEWLPSLLYSSRHLGCLPSSLGSVDTVDWVPVDLMAEIVIDFMHAFDEAASPAVFHGVNPAKSTWKELAPYLAKRLDVHMVSIEEWIEELSKSEHDDVIVNPAVKLLDFFSGLGGHKQAQLDTTQSCHASPTLQNLTPVNERWLDTWLQQWGLGR